jgi:hypothetical protein
MGNLLKRGRGLSLVAVTLCFSGVAFADGSSSQATNGATLSDPNALEKISTSEYSHARQFSDGANPSALQPLDSNNDTQIPDAGQLTEKANFTNHPVRLFQLVSHNDSFKPIGTQGPGNADTEAPSFSPEYVILLILGLVLLAITIAVLRRADNRYRLNPVSR